MTGLVRSFDKVKLRSELDRIIDILEILIFDPVRLTAPNVRCKLYEYLDLLLFGPIKGRSLQSNLFENIKQSDKKLLIIQECMLKVCDRLNRLDHPAFFRLWLKLVEVIDLLHLKLDNHFDVVKSIQSDLSWIREASAGQGTILFGILAGQKDSLKVLSSIDETLRDFPTQTLFKLAHYAHDSNTLSKSIVIQTEDTKNKLGQIYQLLLESPFALTGIVKDISTISANSSIVTKTLVAMDITLKSQVMTVFNIVSTNLAKLVAKLESFMRYMERHSEALTATTNLFRVRNLGAQDSSS